MPLPRCNGYIANYIRLQLMKSIFLHRSTYSTWAVKVVSVPQYLYLINLEMFAAEQVVWCNSYRKFPLHFWKEYEEEVPELSKLAKLVLSFVPNSAGCERRWSSASLIHTRNRNRMKEDNFGKIAKVKDHLRQSNQTRNTARLADTLNELNAASKLLPR